MNYATMGMKIILATLVRTFIFKTHENIEISNVQLKFDTLLATCEPIKIKIEKRHVE